MDLQLIIIYSGLGLLLLIGIVLLILTASIYKSVKNNKVQTHEVDRPQAMPVSEVGIVFCRNCGNQFNSTDKVCPNCKAPR